MISIYHAAGPIWPELGKSLEQPPFVYEMAIYCDFAQPPNLELQSDQKALDIKLQSMAAYKSQVQIETPLAHIRAGGPYEYLREFHFPYYSPNHYKKRFSL